MPGFKFWFYAVAGPTLDIVVPKVILFSVGVCTQSVPMGMVVSVFGSRGIIQKDELWILISH